MNKNKFAKATLLEPRQLNCFVLTRTTSLLKHRVFKKKVPISVLLRGAIKKTYQTLDIVETLGGGIGAAKLFSEKRYGHVLRGEAGQRAMSKVVFLKKFVLGSLKSFAVLKLSTFYMLQNMNFNITYLPKPYQKNFTFWFIRN